MNVYAYAGNDPVSQVDPTGLSLLDWVKDAASAAKKWAEQRMGCSSKASVAWGPIDVTARALEGVPGITRAEVGMRLRRRLIERDENEQKAMDRYERNHGRYVKPGSGPRKQG